VSLSDADLAEILRIAEAAGLAELRIQTPGLSLAVRAAGAPAETGGELVDGGEPAIEVPAPSLGIFRAASRPDAGPPLVVGGRIEPGMPIGEIEVLGARTAVAAGVGGTVVELCAADGRLVEYGEPLVRIRAAG
jgi:acetyl-CoA carboxylase biotin carboxyl carrier protein